MNLPDNFMYTDCGERASLLWLLNYHFQKILRSLDGIPADILFRRPAAHVNPPGWLLAHMAVKERDHIAGFAQGANDVPSRYEIFRGGELPSEQEMMEAVADAAEIADFYAEVRGKTAEYLASISDADLKGVPGHVNQDPIREFFVMTIQHQYYHWGQLETIRKLLGSEKP
ncbi:MAG: DinB family protein [Planctomycetota bacterium]|nr:DinB family protein [Planctomycetota bacterium]